MCLLILMQKFFRIFFIFLNIAICVLLIIFIYSNTTVINEKELRSVNCTNLPPKQYVHPVFLAQGPSIQETPRPTFTPIITQDSSKINCNEISNKTLIIIHSHVNNTENRQFQRIVFSKLWQKVNQVHLYFIVGISHNSKIANESKKYGDLVQVNVNENYHNISYKAQYWIQAISECSAKLVIKIDDDVHTDVIGLQFLISRYTKLDDFIACRVFPRGSVVRNPASKWFLSKDEYKFNDLGTYCQGMAYLISGSLLKSLADNIKRSQILWMDDWYVTRSLVGNNRISYYSLDQHILSTNSEAELENGLQKIRRRNYRTIFAHFRPAHTFPINKRLQVWQQISSINNLCR